MTTTAVSRLHDHARIRPDAPAYREWRDDAWHESSWREYHDQVRRAARALVALGVEPGQKVAILGGNRPQWTVTALATMACRGVMTGIYVTAAPEQVVYVVGHAEARVLVVEDDEQLAKVAAARDELPELEVVMMGEAPEDAGALSWTAFLERGDAITDAELDERIRAIAGDDLATLIYTSGTTGTPKGVMLTHANLAATARIIIDAFDVVSGGESTLSYLPLAHIAEQMSTIHLSVHSAATVHFLPRPERLGEALREVRPTTFFGVPRVWERIHAALMEKLGAATGARRRLVDWALDVGRRVGVQRNLGRAPRGLLAVQAALADRLVLAKVRERLGFSRARFYVSGAAPVAAEILELFSSLGVTIYEVWGLSESSGPGTWNQPGRVRFGTVGQALPGVEVRIAGDGEVLMRGPNVFQGYYKDPELSAETLEDGWLATGDLGALDDDGFLTITGRKKEILITSGGKNVAPAGIESRLKQIELVADAVLIGDRRRFLSALLTLEADAAARFAREHGLPADADLPAHPEIHAALQTEIDRVNEQLARVERVRAFRVLPRPLSVEAGELTPTLKVKRQVVEDHYADVIESIYR